MGKVTVKEGQSIFDICIQETGGISGVFDIAKDNAMDIDTPLFTGQLLDVKTEKENEVIWSSFEVKGITPTTSKAVEPSVGPPVVTAPILEIGAFSDAGHTTPVTSATNGDTVYLTGTPTGITPTSYKFEYEDANGVITNIYEGANDNVGWVIGGSIHPSAGRIFAYATDDGDNWVGVDTSFEVEASLYLDLTTAAPKFAVSVARYLKTSFVGSDIVLVRRSSDNSQRGFTPTEITDGTLLTFVGAGDGFVVRFYDQGGNGNDRTITNTQNQFYLVISGVLQVDSNGNPKVVTQATGEVSPFGNSSYSLDSTNASFSMVSQHFRGRSYGTRWGTIKKGTSTNMGSSGYALQGYDVGSGSANSEVGTPELFINGTSNGTAYTGGDVYGLLGNTEAVTELINIDFTGSAAWLTNFSEFVAVNEGEISEWVLWNEDISSDRLVLNLNTQTFYGY
ncbi:MAG: hypothetical protein ACPGD8_06260 [Flavobacteriales bacterium]